MADEWIKQAFEKASDKADWSHKTAVQYRKFLDENTERILNQWRRIVGEEMSNRVADLFLQDKELCEAIETMGETFFTAGALCGRMIYGKREK